MSLAMRPRPPLRPAPADVGLTPDAQSVRPWIGVRFLCSGQYVRVYRNRAGDAYLAACPRCGRTVRFRVGDGGVRERFFEVSC